MMNNTVNNTDALRRTGIVMPASAGAVDLSTFADLSTFEVVIPTIDVVATGTF
jgi:hypothetical protein